MMLLLEQGAEVDARDQDGRTPLHEAALSRSTAISYILLANLADLEARDEEGSTPLHLAAASGRATVVRRLLEAGADTGAKDGRGRTPMDLASEAGRGNIERAFRRHTLALMRNQNELRRRAKAAASDGSPTVADEADEEAADSGPASAESSG